MAKTVHASQTRYRQTHAFIVNMLRVRTYTDRVAKTGAADFYFSQHPIKYDYGNTGTDREFWPVLGKTDALFSGITHLPTPQGGNQFSRPVSMSLANDVRKGERLITLLRAVNIVGAEVQFAQLIIDKPSGPAPYDLTGTYTGIEHEVQFEGRILSVGPVTNERITLVCDEEEPSLAEFWVYATDETITDPIDVGKRLPVVYGDKPRLPLVSLDVGFVTTLAEDIGINATGGTWEVSDTTGFQAAGSAFAGIERIVWTSKTKTQLVGVSRAQSSTPRTAHSAGDAIVEQIDNATWVVAKHECISIGDVFVRNPFNEELVRIDENQVTVTKNVKDVVTVSGETVSTVQIDSTSLRVLMGLLFAGAQVTRQQEATPIPPPQPGGYTQLPKQVYGGQDNLTIDNQRAWPRFGVVTETHYQQITSADEGQYEFDAPPDPIGAGGQTLHFWVKSQGAAASTDLKVKVGSSLADVQSASTFHTEASAGIPFSGSSAVEFTASTTDTGNWFELESDGTPGHRIVRVERFLHDSFDPVDEGVQTVSSVSGTGSNLSNVNDGDTGTAATLNDNETAIVTFSAVEAYDFQILHVVLQGSSGQFIDAFQMSRGAVSITPDASNSHVKANIAEAETKATINLYVGAEGEVFTLESEVNTGALSLFEITRTVFRFGGIPAAPDVQDAQIEAGSVGFGLRMFADVEGYGEPALAVGPALGEGILTDIDDMESNPIGRWTLLLGGTIANETTLFTSGSTSLKQLATVTDLLYLVRRDDFVPTQDWTDRVVRFDVYPYDAATSTGGIDDFLIDVIDLTVFDSGGLISTWEIKAEDVFGFGLTYPRNQWSTVSFNLGVDVPVVTTNPDLTDVLKFQIFMRTDFAGFQTDVLIDTIQYFQPSTVVDNLDTTPASTWTSSEFTLADETTIKNEGTGSLKLTTGTDITSIVARTISAVDMYDQIFTFDLYLTTGPWDDLTTPGSFLFFVLSDGTNEAHYELKPSNDSLNGWETFGVIAGITQPLFTIGGTPDFAAITTLQMRWFRNGGATTGDVGYLDIITLSDPNTSGSQVDSFDTTPSSSWTGTGLTLADEATIFAEGTGSLKYTTSTSASMTASGPTLSPKLNLVTLLIEFDVYWTAALWENMGQNGAGFVLRMSSDALGGSDHIDLDALPLITAASRDGWQRITLDPADFVAAGAFDIESVDTFRFELSQTEALYQTASLVGYVDNLRITTPTQGAAIAGPGQVYKHPHDILLHWVETVGGETFNAGSLAALKLKFTANEMAVDVRALGLTWTEVAMRLAYEAGVNLFPVYTSSGREWKVLSPNADFTWAEPTEPLLLRADSAVTDNGRDIRTLATFFNYFYAVDVSRGVGTEAFTDVVVANPTVSDVAVTAGQLTTAAQSIGNVDDRPQFFLALQDTATMRNVAGYDVQERIDPDRADLTIEDVPWFEAFTLQPGDIRWVVPPWNWLQQSSTTNPTGDDRVDSLDALGSWVADGATPTASTAQVYEGGGSLLATSTAVVSNGVKVADNTSLRDVRGKALSVWAYCPTATLAKIGASDKVSVWLGSTANLTADYGVFERPSSVLKANQWQRHIFPLTTADTTNGTPDFTRIRAWKLLYETDGTTAGLLWYWDDLRIINLPIPVRVTEVQKSDSTEHATVRCVQVKVLA